MKPSPRDIYTHFTREQILDWCKQYGWKIVGFRPALAADNYWLDSHRLCEIPTQYRDYPIYPGNYRLIIEKI